MNEEEKGEFISAYTDVLTKAWTDEDFSNLLDTDPASALAQCGLAVPEGSNVIVWRHIADDAPEPSIDGAVELWELGKTTGSYLMSVPPAEEISAEELSEADLETINAGWKISCCSCCPCCCCV